MTDREPDRTPSLEALKNLPLAELRALFEALWQRTPPPRIARSFLEGNVAWGIQARQRGEDPMALRRALLQAATRAASGKGISYKPGTRLVREWHGQTHEVTVLDKGYAWQGQTYRSLSEIAREITGTRRSGPRFFGLVKQG